MRAAITFLSLAVQLFTAVSDIFNLLRASIIGFKVYWNIIWTDHIFQRNALSARVYSVHTAAHKMGHRAKELFFSVSPLSFIADFTPPKNHLRLVLSKYWTQFTKPHTQTTKHLIYPENEALPSKLHRAVSKSTQSSSYTLSAINKSTVIVSSLCHNTEITRKYLQILSKQVFF